MFYIELLSCCIYKEAPSVEGATFYILLVALLGLRRFADVVLLAVDDYDALAHLSS
jgi:hypothetical protein